jgi:seryl-tRNA synthetase
MSKRKGFKTAIDKVSESMKSPAELQADLNELKEDVTKTSDTMKQAIKENDKTISKHTPLKKYTLEDAKPPEKKVLEKKRRPTTLMMRPDIRVLLDNIAQNNNVSLSQVLEDILKEYFDIRN